MTRVVDEQQLVLYILFEMRSRSSSNSISKRLNQSVEQN